ncbi:gamma-glutamyltransferase [Urechidicola sp. KH5]
MKIKLLIITLLFSISSMAQKGVTATNGMVVSARKEASEIGVTIMKKGGNAFDAMVATELALAVSYPVAGNIGGGGFMVFRLKDGTTGALDYREKAPKAAHRDMYLDTDGNVIKNQSRTGVLAVGVPGTISGLFEVHKKFGSLPMEELIQPAIDLANKGVVVTDYQEGRIANFNKRIILVNEKEVPVTANFKKGDSIKYKALAKTLKRIRDNGKDEFYKGETAIRLVEHIQRNGGILNMQDLAEYRALWRKPVSFNYKEYTVTSMTLPSSGGICLAQLLNSVEPYNLKELKHNSSKYIQLLTEAERRSYADRAYFLGDSDFVEVPIDTLISKEYTKKRMSNFNWLQATPSKEIAHGKVIGFESEETTHYSIVDPFGNAVSVTTTLNSAYGSKVYIDELGFFLNNQMDDFSVKPGTPNVYGLVGAEANAIAPEKRMLSSMTPTIVSKNDDLKMVVGTPGGSTIITSVFQTILNVLEFDMDMQEAVSKSRFHHQWLPDTIRMEPNGFSEEIITRLEKIGYLIDESNFVIIGKVDAILVDAKGNFEAGADPRGDDAAVGF